MPDLSVLARLQQNPDEAKLLENAAAPVSYLEQFSATDQQHIRRVLDIIIGGQTLDLQRLAYANTGTVIPLAREEELDDYTYRVAGCVGEFWTHLAGASVRSGRRQGGAAVRERRALRQGAAVDQHPARPAGGFAHGALLPADGGLSEHDITPENLLEPVTMERFRPVYDSYLDKTVAHFDAAAAYIDMLPFSQFRMRSACTLPVIIGLKTVTLLRQQNVLDAEIRIKVGRPEIKRMTRQTALALPSRRRTQKLISSYRDA